MLIRKRCSDRLIELCSRTFFLVFLAKRVVNLCRGTSRLSIRRLQSSTQRRSLQLLPYPGEVDDRTHRALPAPADEFRRARQDQLRAFSPRRDGSMGMQFQHGRLTLDTPPRTTGRRLLRCITARSWTVGDILAPTQYAGMVPFLSVIEWSEDARMMEWSEVEYGCLSILS